MPYTVGTYLVRRLEESGLRHIFGIPGDYVLGFYDLLVASRLKVIGTCSEAGAGFAADSYARVHGLGAVCVTYCVGGLNALNAVAGAYAEKSPLIVISGAPGMGERTHGPLLHHKVRDFSTQREIFEKVTVAAEALEDPARAPGQIDSALRQCVRYKRPVYLELPRDVVDRPCAAPRARARDPLRSDAQALREALGEATAMLRAARRPIILGGVEIHRFGLQKLLRQFVEHSGFLIAATLLGKSIIGERHPQYLGIYEGAMGQESVRRAVESADCLLMLGEMLTDIDLGVYTAHLDLSRTINANAERISIRRHHYEQVLLRDFLSGLLRGAIGPRHKPTVEMRRRIGAAPAPFVPQRGKALTIRRFFDRMNHFLDQDSVVICDIGDSLFGAADLTIYGQTEFISPAYYTSMGFAVPAAVGAQVGRRRLRPLVFVGDGAFQMTGMELSTAVRCGLNPIVFVLNNKGYATERFIRDGPYNDIHEWSYHRLPELLRSGWGCEVRTERQLEAALEKARANRKSFSIINVQLEKMDHSRAMERLGRRLGRLQR